MVRERMLFKESKRKGGKEEEARVLYTEETMYVTLKNRMQMKVKFFNNWNIMAETEAKAHQWSQ